MAVKPAAGSAPATAAPRARWRHTSWWAVFLCVGCQQVAHEISAKTDKQVTEKNKITTLRGIH